MSQIGASRRDAATRIACDTMIRPKTVFGERFLLFTIVKPVTARASNPAYIHSKRTRTPTMKAATGYSTITGNFALVQLSGAFLILPSFDARILGSNIAEVRIKVKPSALSLRRYTTKEENNPRKPVPNRVAVGTLETSTVMAEITERRIKTSEINFMPLANLYLGQY